MKTKITHNLAETVAFQDLLGKLQPSKKRQKDPVQIDIWDTLVTGFGLRVSNGGTKTWLLRYRGKNGPRYRMTLGQFPKVGVADARAEAMRRIGQVADRRNPVHELKVAREKADAELTFAQVADLYMRHHSLVFKRPGSQREDQGNLTMTFCLCGAQKDWGHPA